VSTRAFGLAAGIAFAASGCAAAPAVTRIYEGHEVDGRYVESDAYAAFLRGTIAESTGDAKDALASYERAARLDPRSPEIQSRIGAVRCVLNPRDVGADAAFRGALAIDASYAPAWEAQAACAAARGDVATADRASARARGLELAAAGAGNARPSVTAFVRALYDPAADAALDRVDATELAPGAAAVAVAGWAREHDEIPLWVRALKLQLELAPSSRASVAQSVDELVGLGRADDARAVAAAVADSRAYGGPLSCARCELARRLAVDEAIGRNDPEGARRRATEVRLPLDELAARWLLAGRPERARSIAGVLAAADAGAVGARLILDATDPSAGRPRLAGRVAPVSAATWIAWGAALARDGSVDAVRKALSTVPHDAPAPDDDAVLRVAVGLAAWGAVAESDLSPDAAVELRALRWAASGAAVAARSDADDLDPASATAPPLDARHEYLALAMTHPASARTRDLAARLGRLAPHDRVVAAAAAIDALQRGAAIDPASPRTLLGLGRGAPLTE
jgi:hypothetical protein